MSSSALAQTNEEALAAIDEWRRVRDQRCRDPNGWLALAGLHWLTAGTNTIGKSAENSIVFAAESSPDTIGTIVLEDDGKTHFEPSQGVDARINQAPINGRVQLVTDAEDENNPTTVRVESLSFFIIKRGQRFGIRLKDTRAPTLLEFKGIESFPSNLQYRVRARFESWPEGPKELRIPNALGEFDIELSHGQLVFELDGKEYRLTASGDLSSPTMLVFADQTTGKETYGGGRFLMVDPIDPATRETIVDFNKAYNPPCVFTPYATCPRPLPENRLKVRIEAGERVYGHDH